MASVTLPTTTTVDDSSVGTISWVNPNNAKVLDGSYATQDFSPNPPNWISIRPVKNGNITGNSISQAGGWNSGAIAVTEFGGSTDLWGLSWTAADINNSGFGMAIRGGTTFDLVQGHYLKCTGFSFALTDSSKILGIKVGYYNNKSSNVAQIDLVEITVYYQQSQFSNISTVTNISTITI